MERKDLTDNQVTSIMKKVRERVLDAIIPAMNVELERIFGDSLKFSYTTAQNIDAFTSDILFHISALSKSDGICFSLHTQFPDYAISILADRALAQSEIFPNISKSGKNSLRNGEMNLAVKSGK